MFRAFDSRDRRVLWETTLPAAGNATPAVYAVDGKQFVVIGAGGGKWGAERRQLRRVRAALKGFTACSANL